MIMIVNLTLLSCQTFCIMMQIVFVKMFWCQTERSTVRFFFINWFNSSLILFSLLCEGLGETSLDAIFASHELGKADIHHKPVNEQPERKKAERDDLVLPMQQLEISTNSGGNATDFFSTLSWSDDGASKTQPHQVLSTSPGPDVLLTQNEVRLFCSNELINFTFFLHISIYFLFIATD